MKKVILVMALIAFLGYAINPSYAFKSVTKISLADNPPKTDKDAKDVKCDHKDAKCDPAKCDHKDAKCDPAKCDHSKTEKKSSCSSKCSHAKTSCNHEKGKTEEKTPVPQK